MINRSDIILRKKIHVHVYTSIYVHINTETREADKEGQTMQHIAGRADSGGLRALFNMR